MSNTNNNMQTQTSSTLYNTIMEAGGKDRPSMLAPSNYIQWKSRIKRYIDTKPNNELIHYCLLNPPYQYKWITNPAHVKPETPGTEGGSQPRIDKIILTRIDNDIYSTIDACPNAIEMHKVKFGAPGVTSTKMDFPEFYKDLEAKFLGAGAKLMGLQLLQLEFRLEKTPSRIFRPVKSVEILWQFWTSYSLRVSLAHDGSWSKWEPSLWLCG
ncbi:hypothetical protein Tco_0726080 [Tanacetum coccineum]|uniref:Gag-pol polyprotein n=1 Tax=Tanacetum coccineum TaxID=301880 RepID=A0ABQ4YEM3_9ASTR